MEALVCNFDPDWGFSALNWRHGLDLYGDRRILLWEASDGRKEHALIPWPTRVSATTFGDRFMELAGLGSTLPRLILVVAGLSNARSVHTASQVVRSLKSGGPRVLFTAESKFAEDELDSFDYVVVCTAENERQTYYLMRFILELFLAGKSELLSSNTASSRPVKLRVAFGNTAHKVSDRVMQSWPAWAAMLERQSKAILEKGSNPSTLNVLQENAKGFIDDTMALITAAPPEGPGGAMAELPTDIRLPFFHRRRAIALIGNYGRSFYERLAHLLQEWYQRLQREHDNLSEDLAHPAQQRIQELQGEADLLWSSPNRDTVRWLAGTAEQLRGFMHQVYQHLEQVLARMRGECEGKVYLDFDVSNITSPGMRIPLPRFAEDQKVDEAIEEARQAARGLAGRAWFYGSLVVVTVLAALPLTTRALGDSWQFSVLDAGWVAVFTGIFATSLFCVAWWRRRKLGTALEVLQYSMRQAAEQHKQAVQASYSYVYGREALRRLHDLDRLCTRRLVTLQSEIEAVRVLNDFFGRQREYYRSLGGGRAPTQPSANLLKSTSPNRWLERVLAAFHTSSVDRPAKLDVRTGRGRQSVTSLYLVGADDIEIDIEISTWEPRS